MALDTDLKTFVWRIVQFRVWFRRVSLQLPGWMTWRSARHGLKSDFLDMSEGYRRGKVVMVVKISFYLDYLSLKMQVGDFHIQFIFKLHIFPILHFGDTLKSELYTSQVQIDLCFIRLTELTDTFYRRKSKYLFTTKPRTSVRGSGQQRYLYCTQQQKYID